MDDYIILGGGASGLSLGLLTDIPVLEAESMAGGHSLSRIVDGCTFDRGPHIMFSRSPLLLNCLVASLGSNVHQCVRNNKVELAGRIVKYPIENDLGSLEPPMTAACLTDYVRAQLQNSMKSRKPLNLAEWFVMVFGESLTNLYFRPYNEKVWKTKLEDLSMVWSERIPMPSLDDVVKSSLGISTEGYLHQLHYHYPKVGGYGALMDAWASAIEPGRLHLAERVRRIDAAESGVRITTDSGVHKARVAVSTIPLGHLPAIVPDMPTRVVTALSRLRTNATVIVTMAFAGTDTNQWTAVYVCDPSYMPNRISYPAVFSPFNAPAGQFLVQSEIVVASLDDVAHLSDNDIAAHVYAGLRSRNLVATDAELINTYVDRYELAYVVYTSGFEDDLNLVTTWAKSVGIRLHGRFGSHNYLNVDGCLAQSIELAREIGFHLADDDIAEKFHEIGVKNATR